MKKTMLAVVAALGISVLARADNVLWVDAENGVDGAGRGTTEATAFETIQAAVDAAATGYTIKVKPGVYNDGGTAYNGWYNRVFISGKVLRIVSTGGKKATHIVGGSGTRCIHFHDAAGSVVEGFTIRDGRATYELENRDTQNGSGGGVLAMNASRESYSAVEGCVVDCVISNCAAVRGEAMRGGTAVRCFITENSGGDAGTRMANLVNCLLTRNTGSAGAMYNGTALNCSFGDNGSPPHTVKLYNCLSMNNAGGNSTSATCANCVTDSTLPSQFFAPLFDDFRLIKGCAAETAGDASHIASAGIVLPEGVDPYVDLFGNAIPESGVIAAGCIQTAVEPQYGGILFLGNKNILTRGKVNYGPNLNAFAESWPTQFTVQAVNKGDPAIFAFKINVTTTIDNSGSAVFPTMDDTVYIVPPQTAGVIYTNGVRVASGTFYVDPVNGCDETGTGSKTAPVKTLKMVRSKAGGNYARVIRAAAGDYKTGDCYNNGLTNRLVITGYGTRIIGAGAGKSVIWGAPDPNTGSLGPYATRCIYATAVSCVQGFTLRDGYSDNNPAAVHAFAARGGAVFCEASGAYKTNLRIIDCEITNCWSNAGAAGYSGAYERCRITDCHGNHGIMCYATMVSCVVDNHQCDTMTASGNNNSFGRAYQSTFIGRDKDEYIVNKGTGTAFKNCIVMTTKELAPGTSATGSIAYDVGSFTASDGMTYVNPRLADIAAGDYRPIIEVKPRDRLVYSSPAFGGGEWIDLPAFSLADFDGRPLNLIGGKPTVGAYQWPAKVKILPVSIIVR